MTYFKRFGEILKSRLEKSRLQYFQLYLYLFIFIRAANFLSSFPSKMGGDSIRYRAPAIPQELPWYIDPFKYMPEAIWGGAQGPLLPVMVFYLLGNDRLIVCFLSLLSLVSWIYLAKIIDKFYFAQSTKLRRILFGITFLVVSCSPEVLVWNRLIYSESLALSMFAIFLASSLILVNSAKPSAVDLIRWSLSLFFVATTRVDEIFVPILFVIGILFVGKFKLVFSKTAKFIAVFTLVLTFIYNLSAVGAWETQVSRPLVTLSYYISTDSNVSVEVIDFLNNQSEIPDCARIQNVYQAGTQLEWSLPFKKTCKEAIPWAEKTLPKMYLHLLSNHQGKFFLQIFRTVVAGTRYYAYLSGVSAIPMTLHDLVFPNFIKTHVSDNYEARSGVNSFFTFEPLILMCFLAFWSLRKRQRTGDTMKNYYLLWGLVLSLCFSWLTTSILLPGPDSETYRLAIIPNVFLRVLLLLLIHLQIPMERNARND